MRPTRRSVLAAGLSLPISAALPAAPAAAADRRGARAAGTMLVLGGTRFLGPPVVQAGLDAGYTVTLCNRGKSDPDRFKDLELLEVDRDVGDLTPLRGRKWDLVVDTSGYAPLHVQATGEALRDQVGHYVFVSTVSVYPDQSAAVVDETTATSSATPEQIAAAKTIREASANYGPMKAECERAIERAMPGRVTIVRPGLIVGPEDSSDRFTYWPARIARGGEVLAPDDPDAEVQFVDVRDLGVFCFELGAQRKTGVFHGVGFRGRLSFGELLGGCKCTLNTDCTSTWVDEDFLRANKVRPYRDLPLWLPRGQRGHFSTEKAIAAGLRFRPVAETIRDTEAWQRTRPVDHAWRAGLAADRERELLAAWRKR